MFLEIALSIRIRRQGTACLQKYPRKQSILKRIMKYVFSVSGHSFTEVRPVTTVSYRLMWLTMLVLAPVTMTVRLCGVLMSYIPLTIMKVIAPRGGSSSFMYQARREALVRLTMITSRWMLFWLGFSMTETNIPYKPDRRKCGLIVANHLDAADGAVMFALGYTCVVSKMEVADMPMFGPAARLNEAIFIEPGSQASRDEATKRLLAISKDGFREGQLKRLPACAIFPEGTTTNGTSLLPFRKGAFLPGFPVNPVTIRYFNRWRDPSDACTLSQYAALENLLMLRNTKILVTYHPVYIPSQEEVQTPTLFARNVRIFMANELGVPLSNMTPHDGRYFRGESTDYAKCSKVYREVFGPSVLRRNGYYTQRR